MSVIFNWEGLPLRFTCCNAGWASAFSASGPMRPPARKPSVDLRTPRRLYLELLLMFILTCSDLNEIGLACWFVYVSDDAIRTGLPIPTMSLRGLNEPWLHRG